MIPQGTKLSPRTSEPGHEVQPWDSLSEKEKTLFARYMECYAGLVDNVDQNFGRLRGALEEMGEWNNTIVVFLSDNGASENGLHIGASNCFKTGAVGSPGIPEGLAAQVDEDYKWLEEMGGPRTYPQYPRGWAMVSNTPFRLYKGNTHAGGHQVPLIVSWPAKRLESGGIRRQYTYVTDVLPTLIDLIGLHRPTERNGRVVKPIQGESFAPLLQDAEAPSRHTEQYYEIRSSRAYYRDGWESVILYRRRTRLSEQSWELFDITSDPTQLNDLSSERPEKVWELADAWDKAAWENQVYPLDERVGLKWLLREAGMGPPRPMVLAQGAPTLHYATHVIAERSFSIAVDLDYKQGDEGVLVAHGHQGCGFIIYIELGRLTFAYNWFGNMREMDGGAVPPGAREIALHAQAMGNSLWTMGLAVDGETTAGEEFRMFGDQVVHQSLDIGIDRCSPVSWDLHERHGNFRYNGTLHSVTMTPGPSAPDRDPEQVRQRLLEEARKLE